MLLGGMLNLWGELTELGYDEADVTLVGYMMYTASQEAQDYMCPLLGHRCICAACVLVLESWNVIHSSDDGSVFDISAIVTEHGTKYKIILGMHALQECDTVPCPNG